MDFTLSASDAAFRDSVRRFLDERLPDDLRDAGRRCGGIYSDYPVAIRWHRILAEQGWTTPAWPVEWGGTGWSVVQHYLFAREMAEAGAPPLSPNSTHMVGPVVIAFGTDTQKARYLPRIRSGEDWWAQGYSEPGSGSDLASLQCAALRDGNHYVINGSKIWTTHAQWSNKMFCLVRTDRSGKPQQGISFLLFDLDLPGIRIAPIISLAGDHELNQVFFDDVRVPVSALLGRENDGWTVAKYLLEHERGNAWAPLLRARFAGLLSAARQTGSGGDAPLLDDRDLRRRLAAAQAALDALEATELRVISALSRGAAVGVAPSMMKTQGSELRQSLTEIAIDIGFPLTAERPSGGEPGNDAMLGMSRFLNDRAATIYAGSNEIQRNIIAKAMIGR